MNLLHRYNGNVLPQKTNRAPYERDIDGTGYHDCEVGQEKSRSGHYASGTIPR